MADLSAKGRVCAAADQISAERSPTVSTVRELAGVSNADATRYLKAWKLEHLGAAGKTAATPQPVTELAVRMAGVVWAVAATAADARHSEVEKALWEERDHKGREIHEPAAELDKLALAREPDPQNRHPRLRFSRQTKLTVTKRGNQVLSCERSQDTV